MRQELVQLAEKFLADLDQGSAAIFAGAGLSVAAGYVDWKGLLKPLADDLNLDLEREHDLISLAQFHVNDNGRHTLNQQIIDSLARATSPTENHRVLARLPIEIFWTTNYDKLLERSLEDAGKVPDVKYTVNQLAVTRRGRDATVFKMHGDVDHADAAIVTKDDYEKYLRDFGPFVSALSGDLISNTFLFLGFSLSDPNLDYILSRIRLNFQQHQRQHYCVFRRPQPGDFDTDEDHQYASTRLALISRDLQRFNIKTVLIDDYAEITELLKFIERRYRRKTVFLSGSAHDFSPWSREQTEQFLARLGELLIDRGYRVVSGLGLGIGNAFVTGAIRKIYNLPGVSIDDRMIFRPFPQHIPDPDERSSTWTRYRESLLAHSGIAIFAFGNKYEDGRVVNASGVQEEFRIACAESVTPVPIGSSGWVSKEIWETVRSDCGSYYEDTDDRLYTLLERLGDEVSDPMQLLEPVLELIDIISRS